MKNRLKGSKIFMASRNETIFPPFTFLSLEALSIWLSRNRPARG